jgi:hypothetical protein
MGRETYLDRDGVATGVVTAFLRFKSVTGASGFHCQ